MIQEGPLWGRTEIWAGMGRPVPDPPQLLHAVRPDPEQLRQPTSPSDHREQKHETRPEPLQLGQRGNRPGPAIGVRSMTCLTMTAPARTLIPVASWVSTRGPILCGFSAYGGILDGFRERESFVGVCDDWCTFA